MTFETYGSVWQIDDCSAIALFILLNEKEMKMFFNWINSGPKYVKDNIIRVKKLI